MVREVTGGAGTSRAAEGDEYWFENLYRTHHGAVLAYARRRVDDADDVVAEVFSAAWRERHKVPDPPLPWLLRTASNHVLHSRRSFARRLRLVTKAGGTATSTADHAESVVGRVDAAAAVTAAMAHLSAADQEILRLAAWEDLPSDQIAYVLGCTTNSARVRLHRARHRLAEQLARRADQPTRDLPSTKEQTS